MFELTFIRFDKCTLHNSLLSQSKKDKLLNTCKCHSNIRNICADDKIARSSTTFHGEF